MLRSVDFSRGGFLILEGADGSGKTTLAHNIRGLLMERGISCSIASRSPASGREVYSQLTRAIFELFADVERERVPTNLLLLAAAAQHSAIFHDQVVPAVKYNQSVIIADSWWDKTWVRLCLEAERVGEGSVEWQKYPSLIEYSLLQSPQICKMLIEANRDEREQWYQAKDNREVFYDREGNETTDSEIFGGFTDLMRTQLRERAVVEKWTVMQNRTGEQNSVAEAVVHLILGECASV